MIINYDRRPSATVDQKLQSLLESVQLALNEKIEKNALLEAIAKALSEFEGESNAIYYGKCITAASTAAKTTTIPGVKKLEKGITIFVRFLYSNTASNPTLKVNDLPAKGIMRYGTTAVLTSAASSWNAESVVPLTFDGTYWIINGWLNTTYSSMTQAEMRTGTATTARLITAARLKEAIGYHAPFTDSTSGDWHVRKWNSGKIEAWFSGSVSCGDTTASGSIFYGDGAVTIPSGIFTSTPECIASVRSTAADGLPVSLISMVAHATSSTNIDIRMYRTNAATTTSFKANIYAWTD